jgi:1,4-dihydroxy-2-naphthoate octaprenyltransferase
MKKWLTAFRLRTLPLALSSIGMGSFLAASTGDFKWIIFLLCCLTTIFLQILSNLANDYGDTVNGADSAERTGPQRSVQSGAITINTMRRAIGFFILLSLISGIYLLFVSVGLNLNVFLFFLSLGILAIIAAITYTAGKNPYGYAGLGDISVLLFFGLLGVLGSNFLFTQKLDLNIIMPALSCGLFSVAVLNINNIRDIESDRKAGKFSIPVRIGRKAAITYHMILIIGGLLTSIIYTIMNYHSLFQLLFLLVIPLLVINAKAVKNKKTADELDPYLKQMALSTLVFVIFFGLGLIL